MNQILELNQIVAPTSKWQITIPKSAREDVGLTRKTLLNVYVEEGKIVLLPVKMTMKEDVWSEERRRKLLAALDGAGGIWKNNRAGIKKILSQRKRDIEEIKKLKAK